MFLNDIGRSPDAVFGKVNKLLESNYGFKIPENASEGDIYSIMEQIEGEVDTLKFNGDISKNSPEISKRLLILEGLKSLMEYAAIGFQSPDLNREISRLVDVAKEEFRIAGASEEDFQNAVDHAMKSYRSSPYRFPDDLVERRVKEETLRAIEDELNSHTSIDEADYVDEEEEPTGIDPFAQHAAARKQGVIPNPAAMQTPTAPHNKLIPMVKDKTGNMVQDPFAAQAAVRRKGIVMKEKATLVKNLRRLLETEVSQAEVMMAAKGFAQEIQEMVEKIGRLQNEDLPPVTDQMRETYGTDSASAFQTQIYSAFQGIMDALYTAKNQVDDAVESMASTGQVGASIDMDKDLGGADMGADMGTDVPMDADLDLDNIGDEPEVDDLAGDEFGGAEMDEPLGRSKKMEAKRLEKKILEMRKLVEKAKKLKESRK